MDISLCLLLLINCACSKYLVLINKNLKFCVSPCFQFSLVRAQGHLQALNTSSGQPILAFLCHKLNEFINLAPRNTVLGFIWFEHLASFERAQSSMANEFTIFLESKQRGRRETEVTKRHQFHKIISTIDITNGIIIDVFTRRMSIILLFTGNLSIPKMGQIASHFIRIAS